MNPDRWPEVSRVFAGASALVGKERAAYLDDVCLGDSALRVEVESLLAAHDAAGPLDRSSLGIAADIAASPARRLTVGARLGPYLIESWVGAGGMGEVYRALDTKLGRVVAIKVLPDSVAHEGDRRNRLEREARALAALNHPHVGAIYGLEESGDVAALVLEFVDGPTLDQRLARGRLSIDEITHIARQLAEALEAAHDSGIVHRDLKPANIKITPGGNVKVLDFGLAKAIGAPIADVADHPIATTSTATATQDGTIVGTPGYMSPEQARGDTVDKRADIWAFGCVVFEMCCGLAPFAGSTIAEATAAVIQREPAWETLPASTPAYLVRLLRRCLTKDPKLRLRDIGEARIALLEGGDSDTGRVQPPVPMARRRAPWTIAAAAVLVAVTGLALGWWSLSWSRRTTTSQSNVQFQMFPPAGVPFNRHVARTFFALSPDGSQLAFVAKRNRSEIYLRAMADVEARTLPGTDGANSIFWSPDGRSLAFLTETTLKRIDLPAGAPVALAEVQGASAAHGTWGSGGTILVGMPRGTGIYSVPAAGGGVREILTPDRSKGEVRVTWPWFLPDGERFLYTVRLDDGEGEVRLGELDGGFRPVLRASSNAQWIDPDTIVFVREGVLLGQRIDLASARPIGDPFSIAQPVDYFITTSRAMFSVSRSGAVAYHAGGDRWQLVWMDQGGNEVGTIGAPAEYETTSGHLSGDGTMLLTARRQPELGTYDLWRLDLVRHTEERLTANRGSELTPMWIDDDRAVVYVADSGGGVPHLFRRDLSSGVEDPLLPSGPQQLVTDVVPGGGAVVYVERTQEGRFDIFRLSLTAGASPEVLLRSRQSKLDARISPDGRAMAFLANEEELRKDLYIVSLPMRGAPVVAAANVEGPPRWSADGSTLYYVGPDHTMMALAVRTAPALTVGSARLLFEMKRPAIFLEVSRDGRFLMLVTEVSAGQQPITVSTARVHPAR